MCGIVGYVGPKDCSEVLVNALTKLEYRGYDSAGIAVFDNGEIKTVKTKGKLQDLKDKLAGRHSERSCRHRSHPLGNPRRAFGCKLTSTQRYKGYNRSQRYY